MATSSACAVGSRSAMVRLPARAITVPLRTIAQPTGTSPRAAAAWASSMAICMNEAIASPSCPALCRASTSLYTGGEEDVEGRGIRRDDGPLRLLPGHDQEDAHV